jgi:hypothetical protein
MCFESSILTWRVYSGDNVNVIASANDINDKSKYNISKNPSTGLYYRLHILNVEMSDFFQLSFLLSNPHCRTTSPPCTTYTGVGFDIPLVQQTLPIH